MFNIDTIVSEFVALTEMERQTKKRIDELRTIIFDHAGDSDSFTTSDYTIIIKQTESIRLDTKELYKDFPDIKKTYGKTSISKSIVAAKRDDTKTA